MSWFNFGASSSQPQNSIDVAREAIKYFHNENSKFAGYSITMDQLLSTLAARGGSTEQISIFLDGFGTAILSIQQGGFLQGSNDLQSAMESLADKSQGKIPSQASFFKALSDKAADPSFIDTFSAVASGSAVEIGKGAVAIGDSVIESGKLLTTFLPIMVLVAVGFIVYSKTRKIA